MIKKIKGGLAFLAVPFRVPIGWVNRLYVLAGTALILVVRYTMIQVMVYVVIWWAIYLLILGNVFFRGWRAACQQMNDGVPEDIVEAVMLTHNARLVALDDLANLCMKYGIPPEEAVPIIERGYGIRVER